MERKREEKYSLKWTRLGWLLTTSELGEMWYIPEKCITFLIVFTSICSCNDMGRNDGVVVLQMVGA